MHASSHDKEAMNLAGWVTLANVSLMRKSIHSQQQQKNSYKSNISEFKVKDNITQAPT